MGGTHRKLRHSEMWSIQINIQRKGTLTKSLYQRVFIYLYNKSVIDIFWTNIAFLYTLNGAHAEIVSLPNGKK